MAVMERDLATLGPDLFAANEGRYLGIAKNTALGLLLAVPNQEVDRGVWAERADDFVELIFSRLAGNALEISWAGRAEDDAPGGAKREITYDDVLRWVEAGPGNGGKDKSAVENTRGRPDEQIAYDVYTAIKQYRLGLPSEKDYGPITERLERWIDFGESANYFLELLPEILETWHAVLESLLMADFSEAVDEVLNQW